MAQNNETKAYLAIGLTTTLEQCCLSFSLNLFAPVYHHILRFLIPSLYKAV